LNQGNLLDFNKMTLNEEPTIVA